MKKSKLQKKKKNTQATFDANRIHYTVHTSANRVNSNTPPHGETKELRSC